MGGVGNIVSANQVRPVRKGTGVRTGSCPFRRQEVKISKIKNRPPAEEASNVLFI
jgi:hypothetical protein